MLVNIVPNLELAKRLSGVDRAVSSILTDGGEYYLDSNYDIYGFEVKGILGEEVRMYLSAQPEVKVSDRADFVFNDVYANVDRDYINLGPWSVSLTIEEAKEFAKWVLTLGE